MQVEAPILKDADYLARVLEWRHDLSPLSVAGRARGGAILNVLEVYLDVRSADPQEPAHAVTFDLAGAQKFVRLRFPVPSHLCSSGTDIIFSVVMVIRAVSFP